MVTDNKSPASVVSVCHVEIAQSWPSSILNWKVARIVACIPLCVCRADSSFDRLSEEINPYEVNGHFVVAVHIPATFWTDHYLSSVLAILVFKSNDRTARDSESVADCNCASICRVLR